MHEIGRVSMSPTVPVPIDDLDALAALVHRLRTDLTPLVACADVVNRLPAGTLPPTEQAITARAAEASDRTIHRLNALTALVARVR